MPKKVTPEQRDSVLRMLATGQDRDTIAAAVGVTPGQVSAISAHVKMGTYALPQPDAETPPAPAEAAQDAAPPPERTTNLLRQLQRLEVSKDATRGSAPSCWASMPRPMRRSSTTRTRPLARRTPTC
jgi:hypothetical protein